MSKELAKKNKAKIETLRRLFEKRVKEIEKEVIALKRQQKVAIGSLLFLDFFLIVVYFFL